LLHCSGVFFLNFFEDDLAFPARVLIHGLEKNMSMKAALFSLILLNNR